MESLKGTNTISVTDVDEGLNPSKDKNFRENSDCGRGGDWKKEKQKGEGREVGERTKSKIKKKRKKKEKPH